MKCPIMWIGMLALCFAGWGAGARGALDHATVLDLEGDWEVVQTDAGPTKSLFLASKGSDAWTHLASVEVPSETVTNVYWDAFAGWNAQTGDAAGGMVTNVETIARPFEFNAFVNAGSVYWVDWEDGTPRLWTAPCGTPETKTLLATGATGSPVESRAFDVEPWKRGAMWWAEGATGTERMVFEDGLVSRLPPDAAVTSKKGSVRGGENDYEAYEKDYGYWSSGRWTAPDYDWQSPFADRQTVEIPDGVGKIGNYVFYRCTQLESVTIPESVKSIGQGAFSGCSGLTNMAIGNGVTTIGQGAFSGCSGLTSVTIPESVTGLESAAFSDCHGLTSVTILGNIMNHWGYIWGSSWAFDTSPFRSCPILSTIVLGGKMTQIGNFMFYGCSGLKNVAIGNGVTTIGQAAFYGCSGLTSVTIPDSVRSIGDWAFRGCSGLTNVTIPDSVTSIGSRAFEGCSGLTSVTIPDSVTSIGENAFSSCSGLTSVTIPDSVTSIGANAFYGCSGLTSVAFGDSVTSIGDSAFYGCSGLLFFSVAAGNPQYSSVNGLLLNKDGTTLLLGVNGDVTIPDSVTRIGSSAFSGCSGLTSVTIGDSVTSIEYHAFYGCSGLTSVTIPDSVTSIGGRAFEGCSGLTSVTILGNVKNDWFYHSPPFYSCPNISTLVLGEKMTKIGSDMFYGCSGLTSVTIPDSVTSIGDSAFYGCSGLTSVTIPDSVTSIGNCAFDGCSGLTSVTIPDSVTSIGDSAFYGCSALTNVTIGNGVTSIGGSAFYGCSGLTTLFVPAAWEGTDKLEYASVPAGCIVGYGSGPLGLTESKRSFTIEGAAGQQLGVVANVPWTAESSASWLTVKTRSGTGNGTIVYDVAANTGGERTATLTVSGGGVARTFTVEQAGVAQTVTFLGNGGAPETQTGTYTVEGRYGSFPSATREGYAFAGWWTAAAGGTQVPAGSTVTTNMVRTLYAHWTPNRYAVTLDRQGGAGGTASVTAVFGSGMPAVEAPARAGFAFAGYYAAAGGGGAQYYWPSGLSARAWDQASAATLYAHWMPVDPAVSISPTERNFGTNGGFFAVATAGSGTWEAVASDDWIVLGSATGQAGYPLAYEVSPATQAEDRTGYVYVAGHVHTVTQDGLGGTISPKSAVFEKEGGTGTVKVTAGTGIPWQASADCDWLAVTPAEGTGKGQVTYTVAPLDAVAMREGTLTVAGKTFKVTQYGRRMAISPASAEHDDQARTVSVEVEALDTTEWSVAPGAAWITVADAGSGKGSGTVRLAFAENPGWKARTGAVAIGTETFTVTQQGRSSLAFAIRPVTASASATGANGSVSVTATPDLPWSAASQTDWLTLKTDAGAGNGSVTYSVEANPTLAARTGTIVVTPGDSRVSAKTHAVTQAAAAATLSAARHEFPAAGGECTVQVTVSAIVRWSIENSVAWLALEGTADRTGPGTVTLRAAANPMLEARSGTVTIAGKPFTVTQKAATSSLSPAGFEFAAAGESCTVSVTVPDNVQWPIQNTNAWLEVEGAANRTGPGNVVLRALPNTSVHPRAGMVSIAGKTFKAAQKAGSLELDCETKVFGMDGGSDSIAIRADSQVDWKAVVSDPTWITLFGADSGTGSGSIRVIVLQGEGETRTGTITVENKVMYVTQRAFDLTITPAKVTVEGGSGTGSFTVSTGNDNVWQATTAEPWITLDSTTGTGNGTVSFAYAANDTGTDRVGKIVVVGEVYTLVQQSRPPFPEAQSEMDVESILEGVADERLREKIQSPEDYERFLGWLDEKGLDRQGVKASPHAWISYALGADRLFSEEPTLQISGLGIARRAVKDTENRGAMAVSVVVADSAGDVPVNAGKIAALFKATGDLRDWDGDANLPAAATQTGIDGAAMQFEVVPGDGTSGAAFLRLGLEK